MPPYTGTRDAGGAAEVGERVRHSIRVNLDDVDPMPSVIGDATRGRLGLVPFTQRVMPSFVDDEAMYTFHADEHYITVETEGLYMIKWSASWMATPGLTEGSIVLAITPNVPSDESTEGIVPFPLYSMGDDAIGSWIKDSYVRSPVDMTVGDYWDSWVITNLPAGANVWLEIGAGDDSYPVQVDYPAMEIICLV